MRTFGDTWPTKPMYNIELTKRSVGAWGGGGARRPPPQAATSHQSDMALWRRLDILQSTPDPGII